MSSEDWMGLFGQDSTDDEHTVIDDSSSGPTRRPNPAKHWSFTWNNYPDTWETDLQTALSSIAAYAAQEETGENGTPHIQGCLKANQKIRPFNLGLPRTIHWEVSRGSWQDNLRYCTKEESRTGKTVTHNCAPPRSITIIQNLRPWQSKLETLLLGEPDERKIYWVWESTGNVGKSSFVKYMAVKHNNIVRGSDGKKSDIINLAFNTDWDSKTAMVIDLPRSYNGAIAFGAIEDIKNGYITNTKYETGEKVFATPHILIFSNYPPLDLSQVSADRWVIKEIINNDIDL